MMEDTIRVLRIIEYVGGKEVVERQIEKSIQGTLTLNLKGGTLKITATTLGMFPEIIQKARDTHFEGWSAPGITEE